MKLRNSAERRLMLDSKKVKSKWQLLEKDLKLSSQQLLWAFWHPQRLSTEFADLQPSMLKSWRRSPHIQAAQLRTNSLKDSGEYLKVSPNLKRECILSLFGVDQDFLQRTTWMIVDTPSCSLNKADSPIIISTSLKLTLVSSKSIFLDTLQIKLAETRSFMQLKVAEISMVTTGEIESLTMTSI